MIHNRTCRSQLALAAAGIFILTLGSSIALADTVTYQLGDPNTVALGPGPYGSVTVNRTTTTMATITFSAGADYLFTDGNEADVNVNATSFSSTNPTFTQLAGFSAPSYTQSSGTVDGKGSFNLVWDNNGGSFTDSVKTLTFTVTDLSGTWASAGSVLAVNNLGNLVAAHVGYCSAPCSINTPFGTNTGFVTNTSAVPEPGVISMLGVLGGLIAFVGFRRRVTTN
jgi:hypothetical protein